MNVRKYDWVIQLGFTLGNSFMLEMIKKNLVKKLDFFFFFSLPIVTFMQPRVLIIFI
jgi:hypothetical protein